MSDRRKFRLIGFLCMILASALYGLTPLFVTSLTSNGAHFTNAMFFKGSIAAVELIIINLLSRKRMVMRAYQHKRAIVLGALRGMTCLLLYWSYCWISTGMATSLHFVFPLFVTMIGMLFIRERPQKNDLISLIITMVGVMLFIWSVQGEQASWLGILLAILSALAYGSYLVVLNQTNLRDVPPTVYSMYEMIYAAAFACITSALAGKMQFTLTREGWIMAFIGSTISAVSLILMKIAMGRISAQKAAILCVLEPIVSTISGVLLLHEIINLQTAIGICCVLSASIITVVFDRPEASAA